MAQQKNDNWDIRAPKPIDQRQGKLVGGVWVPFDSVAEAHTMTLYKYISLTLPVKISGQTVEYWYKNATASQSDLVEKVPAPTQSSGVTKDAFTVSADTTRVIPAGMDLLSIRLKSISGLTAFKVGTTTGNDDIVSSRSTLTDWKSLLINEHFPTNTTLYFSGITSQTQITLILV